jgi:hypothetical protein
VNALSLVKYVKWLNRTEAWRAREGVVRCAFKVGGRNDFHVVRFFERKSNSDDVEVVATGEWFGASLPPTFDPPEPANKANYSLLWGLMWQMFL